MIPAACVVCGASFLREVDQDWKRKCWQCWLQSKNAKAASAPSAHAEVVHELAENIPALIGLVHPDRHSNSAASNRITAWLLDVRRRLPELERAA